MRILDDQKRVLDVPDVSLLANKVLKRAFASHGRNQTTHRAYGLRCRVDVLRNGNDRRLYSRLGLIYTQASIGKVDASVGARTRSRHARIRIIGRRSGIKGLVRVSTTLVTIRMNVSDTPVVQSSTSSFNCITHLLSRRKCYKPSFSAGK